IGFIGVNMTLVSLSEYLRDHRFSAHSVTVIVDDKGHVIAHPDRDASVHIVDGKPQLALVADLADRRIVEAVAHRDQARGQPFRFTSQAGESLAVAAEPFPTTFGTHWEVVVVAPTADFVGELETTNRHVFGMLAIAVAFELLIIYLLSRSIARHIARVSEQFVSARRLSFSE